MKFFYGCGKCSEIINWVIKILRSFSRMVDYFLDFILARDPFWKEISELSYEEKYKILSRDANFVGKSFVENLETIFDYKNKKVQQLIWQMKFRENKAVAEFFGSCLAEKICGCWREILEKEFHASPRAMRSANMQAKILLLPIPIHKKRRSERGYNQCEWLAEEIIKKLKKNNQCQNLVYHPNILMKQKYTIKQSWIKRDDRLKNLENSFRVSEKYSFELSGNVVMLIDDVCTTGTTLNEARRTLLASGAKSVYFFTIAH